MKLVYPNNSIWNLFHSQFESITSVRSNLFRGARHAASARPSLERVQRASCALNRIELKMTNMF